MRFGVFSLDLNTKATQAAASSEIVHHAVYSAWKKKYEDWLHFHVSKAAEPSSPWHISPQISKISGHIVHKYPENKI